MTPLQLARKIKSQHWLGWLGAYASPEPMVESCSITAELHCDAGVDAFARCKQPASGRIESGIRRVNHKTPTAPTLHRPN